ncbi:DUF6273 domain-containing protein [Rummeliibacillus pycnus]|uniref:DUF6273 domain-containing protein n=1 Tax=Rummeliibacillus pycnus TaxID=101070 RepID=UPI0037C93723
MVQAISNLSVGSLVKDPSANYNWIIIEQGSGYTTLIKETVADLVKFSSNAGVYPNSELDTYFGTTFYNTLSNDLKSKLLTTTIVSHTNDTIVVDLTRLIYALSLSEISGGTFEGSLIPYFSSDSRRTAGGQYWTRSIVPNDSTSVYCVVTYGGINGQVGKYSTSTYARPAMRIYSSTTVSDTASSGVYSLVFNEAPTISGSDTNVGQKTDPFTYDYTVNDANSTDNLTITEKANGVTIRTITNAVRGQKYTADLSSVWKQMPVNTATTLTITVSDGSLSTTRTITFTRKEDRVVAYFKPASLIPESVQPLEVLVRVIRTIATNADFKIFICNNGLDTSPTWEDVTSAVLAGEAYKFTNRMKTAENYAVNVKIQVLKNTASTYSYIKALGFSYI